MGGEGASLDFFIQPGDGGPNHFAGIVGLQVWPDGAGFQFCHLQQIVHQPLQPFGLVVDIFQQILAGGLG